MENKASFENMIPLKTKNIHTSVCGILQMRKRWRTNHALWHSPFKFTPTPSTHTHSLQGSTLSPGLQRNFGHIHLIITYITLSSILIICCPQYWELLEKMNYLLFIFYSKQLAQWPGIQQILNEHALNEWMNGWMDGWLGRQTDKEVDTERWCKEGLTNQTCCRPRDFPHTSTNQQFLSNVCCTSERRLCIRFTNLSQSHRDKF